MKGKQVGVVGELRTRTWEHEGRRHYRTEVHTTKVELMSRTPARATATDGTDTAETEATGADTAETPEPTTGDDGDETGAPTERGRTRTPREPPGPKTDRPTERAGPGGPHGSIEFGNAVLRQRLALGENAGGGLVHRGLQLVVDIGRVRHVRLERARVRDEFLGDNRPADRGLARPGRVRLQRDFPITAII